MPHVVVISANQLVWPQVCSACMDPTEDKLRISTTKITSRNMHEASWDIPYCKTCQSKGPVFGGRKGFFANLFASSAYAVDYRSLHLTAHKLAFYNKEYLDKFLASNGSKKRSEVWED